MECNGEFDYELLVGPLGLTAARPLVHLRPTRAQFWRMCSAVRPTWLIPEVAGASTMHMPVLAASDPELVRYFYYECN